MATDVMSNIISSVSWGREIFKIRQNKGINILDYYESYRILRIAYWVSKRGQYFLNVKSCEFYKKYLTKHLETLYLDSSLKIG